MADKSTDFIQRLVSADDLSPALLASYRAELENIVRPPLTARSAAPGAALMVVLLGCVVGIVRTMFLYTPEPLVLVAWGVLTITFLGAAALIARDLWNRKHSRRSVLTIAHLLTFAGGSMTVAALLAGLSAPGDPKSMFNAFFVFVFYVACIAWTLDCRIGAAELAAREQALRLECRLADLAERLPG